MAGRLQGKVAFISGIAKGQGRAHALRFAQEGADIIGFDVCAPMPGQGSSPSTEADLAFTVEQVEKLDRRVVAGVADSRDRASVQAVYERGLAELGRLDIVVANAGVTPAGSGSLDLSDDDWRGAIDIDLTGVFNTVAIPVPTLIEQGTGGSIIITSSSLGLKPFRGLPSYVAAKSGVIGLMRTMALELGEHSIRVNTVHPTAVGTDMLLNESIYRMYRPDLENPTKEDAMPAFKSIHALPVPYVDPSDITNAVLFLASDEARMVTGVTFPVDAGMIIKLPDVY